MWYKSAVEVDRSVPEADADGWVRGKAWRKRSDFLLVLNFTP